MANVMENQEQRKALDLDSPFVLYRVKLREKVSKALRKRLSTDVAFQNVFTAFNWPIDASVMPAIWVSSPGDEGKSNGAGPPDFNRTTTIAIKAVVSEETPDKSQRRIDEILGKIQHFLMTDHELQLAISEVEFIKEENILNADDERYFAEGRILIGLNYQQTYELTEGELLTGFEGIPI